MAWKSSVLVVAKVTAASDELLAAMRSRADRAPTEFTLLMPAGWGEARFGRHAVAKAVDRMTEAGLDVRGIIGDSDPVVAVHEHWDPRWFDEVIVSTLPTGTSRWLQIDLPRRIERITDAPVQHVIAKPAEEPRRTYAPPPKRDDDGLLMPLVSLGWGGKREPAEH